MCTQPVMKPMLDSIKARCLQKWARDGLTRHFKKVATWMEDGKCTVTFQVEAESTKDQTYPVFEDDCLLYPKPEPCGIASQDLPWPLKCRLTMNPDYTPEEDALLIQLRAEGQSWTEIAKEFTNIYSERSPKALENHYNSRLRPGLKAPPPRPLPPQGRKHSQYTSEEIEFLRKMRQDERRSWEEIADAFSTHFPGSGRTPKGLKGRYRTEFGNTAHPERLSPYTPEENARLRGMKDTGRPWEEIAKAFPGRSIKALKAQSWRLERGQGKELRPWSEWTPEEDQRLKALKGSGLSWSQVIEQFPGRSTSSIKTRYYREFYNAVNE